ncbi:MAG TPA: 50S ribosomal protein L19e [Candidatus Nanoarchaeia archaeon]|nr:50S ribosomal protein L19e [Candidatus Nanoarchaeia archaeon]
MKSKKILAAKILKTSPYKVRFAAGALDDIRKAITRSDMRGLIAVKKVMKAATNEHSRGRARKIASQKRKGRRKGRGSKKGAKYSSVDRKTQWTNKIRIQRKFLSMLRDKGLLNTQNYRALYNKSKGGYFRNRRHIKLYLTEHKLIDQNGK